MLSHHNIIEMLHFSADLLLGMYMSGNRWDSAALEAFALTFASSCISKPHNVHFRILVCFALSTVLCIRRFNYHFNPLDTIADCFHEIIHFVVGCFFSFLLIDLDAYQIIGVSLLLFVGHIVWQVDSTRKQIPRHCLIGILAVRLLCFELFKKQVAFFA